MRPVDQVFPKAKRQESIENAQCVQPPYGCAKEIWSMDDEFRDALSVKEFFISGLCQECQDDVFGGEEDA